MLLLPSKGFALNVAIINLLCALVSGQCTNPQPRKDIRELSKFELDRYVNAVNLVHNNKTVDRSGLNALDRLTKIHSDNFPSLHGHAVFLPWHRKFLSEYEKLLQTVDKDIKLPYWDWTLDSRYPDRSIVLSEQYYGGNGDTSAGYCLESGAFANWVVKNPNTHCLPRDYDEGDTLGSFTSAEDVNAVLNEGRFSDFSYVFELYHGDPHTGIGGDNGDFSGQYSANDPLFFLHHNFIDWIWAEYQSRHPKVQFDAARYRENTNASSNIPVYNIPISSVLDTTKNGFCFTDYRYPRALNIPSDSPAFVKVEPASNPPPSSAPTPNPPPSSAPASNPPPSSAPASNPPASSEPTTPPKSDPTTPAPPVVEPPKNSPTSDTLPSTPTSNPAPKPTLRPIFDHINKEGIFQLNLSKILFGSPIPRKNNKPKAPKNTFEDLFKKLFRRSYVLGEQANSSRGKAVGRVNGISNGKGTGNGKGKGNGGKPVATKPVGTKVGQKHRRRAIQFKRLTDKNNRRINPKIAILTHRQVIDKFMDSHQEAGKVILPKEADPALALKNFLQPDNKVLKIPFKKPISKEWIKRNGFVEEDVRKVESARQIFHAILNLDPEFKPFDGDPDAEFDNVENLV